jgi:hypothetical protein
MIPKFPKFKSLELTDNKEIEKFTSKFPPYSDFNFVSLWSWDIKGEIRISMLNNNLVVRFTDYVTGELFYSFLGDEKENETVEELFKFLEKENSKQILKLISEEIGHKLVKSNFSLVLDQDSYDYIYSVSHLSKMQGWTKNSSGKNIRNFIKKYPNYVVKHCPIKETKKDEFIGMFKKWARNKGAENYLELNENKALVRIFDIKDENVNTVSLYVNGIFVGFTIYEILSSNYAISHFAKTDITFHNAISDILNWEEAKILDTRGVKFFNWEQDLGIPGLRKSKEKYRPSFLFKKLTISHKN